MVSRVGAAVLPPTCAGAPSGPMIAAFNGRAVPYSTTSASTPRSSCATAGCMTGSLRCGRTTEVTLIRSAVGEAQLVDQHGRATPPVIDDDAHQLRQRGGPVRRTAEGGRQRGNEPLERESHPTPVGRHMHESIALDMPLDTQILRPAIVRLEQPRRRHRPVAPPASAVRSSKPKPPASRLSSPAHQISSGCRPSR